MDEVSTRVNLQLNYGVVKFRGTIRFNRNHELVFQSNSAAEAMSELERLCATEEFGHGYMLILRSSSEVENE